MNEVARKVIVVGVDGMDPRLAKKYLDAGKMPNMKKQASIPVQKKNVFYKS